MPKRKKLSDDERDRLQRCLQVRGASERAVLSIWNICNENRANIARGTFQEEIQEILGPWKSAVIWESFPPARECGDKDFVVPLIDLAHVVRELCKTSEAFHKSLHRALQVNPILTPIVYCDECTAGNVLSVDKGRKACIFYLSWVECWHLLKNPNMWVPMAAVQADCLQQIQGGASAVVTAILSTSLTVESEAGFNMSFHGLTFKFRQKQQGCFLADNEGIRSVYTSKGSAGIRLCLHCSNVVKRDTDVSRLDDLFVEIDACEGFQPVTDQEIFSALDDLQHCRTKADMEMKEKCAGICWVPGSLMASNQRWKLPPSRIITDFLHTYLVNGCASWEVALLCKAVFEKTDINLKQLELLVLQAEWKGTKSSGKTQNYTRRLFDPRMFSDSLYKGQGHHTAAITPLIRYYAETVLATMPEVPRECVASFSLLCDILVTLKNFQHRLDRLDAADCSYLQKLQQKHHRAFGLAFGSACFKPKHHHRFHLVQGMKLTGSLLSTDPLESKHSLYKSGVAVQQRATVCDYARFSAAVLHRLVKASFDNLEKGGLPFWELLPPISSASMEDKIIFGQVDLQESNCPLKVNSLGTFYKQGFFLYVLCTVLYQYTSIYIYIHRLLSALRQADGGRRADLWANSRNHRQMVFLCIWIGCAMP